MTEEEAKTKWCPFARYGSISSDHSANRWKQQLPEDEPHSLNPIPCRCIGSACMAWRWWVSPATAAFENENEKFKAAPDRVTHIAVGYCGLAGRP